MLTLALGGGGARGLAHLGVLQVLEREALPLHGICGTSMGGLIGALFAAGLPCAEIEERLLDNLRMRKLLRLIDPGWSKQGLNVQGERLRKRLAKILGGSPEIEELEHPLAVVTTEMQSGRRFVIDRGPVIDAVRSTISIPMLFEPVQREGLVLADGGLLENLPVRAARELFGGPVIGVDVLPDFASNALGGDPTHDPIRTKRLPRRINDAMHAITVMMQSNTQLLIDVSRPELVLRPELPRNVTVLSGWSKASQLIAAGRSAAEAALPQLRELAKR